MENQIFAANSERAQVGDVTFPVETSQLHNFIVSLLGKPQIIKKSFTGSFDINLDNLLDLFQIIEQRVKQQNEGSLLEFRANIVYNDNSSVLLSGFEHFVNYNEPLPLVVKSIELTWQYLIRFKDKPTPEKQEVSVFFITSVDFTTYLEEDLEYSHFRNKVSFKISHTARTWGADMESLLTRHLSVLVKPINRLQKEIMQMHHNFYANIIPVFFMSVTILTIILWFRTGSVLDYLILITTSYILNRVTQIFINLYEPSLHPAFILITRELILDKERVLTRYHNKWKAWYITIFLSMALSVLSNIIYVRFFEIYFK